MCPCAFKPVLVFWFTHTQLKLDSSENVFFSRCNFKWKSCDNKSRKKREGSMSYCHILLNSNLPSNTNWEKSQWTQQQWQPMRRNKSTKSARTRNEEHYMWNGWQSNYWSKQRKTNGKFNHVSITIYLSDKWVTTLPALTWRMFVSRSDILGNVHLYDVESE